MVTILPSTSGSGIDYTRTDKSIASLAHQRYHVWVPPGPHPGSGRPLLVNLQGSQLETHPPAATISDDAGFAGLPYRARAAGWVFADIGQTGWNDPGTDVSPHGFYPHPYADPATEWEDPDIFSQEKDVWCGIQHLLKNAALYHINPHKVVILGRSGGAMSAQFVTFNPPEDLAYASGDPISAFVDFTVLGCILAQHGTLWIESWVTGPIGNIFPHWDLNGSPGTPATDVDDVEKVQLRESSAWFQVAATTTERAWAVQKSICFWYGATIQPESTNFNTAGGTPPSSTNFLRPALGVTVPAAITDPHSAWNGQMFWRYWRAASIEQANTAAFLNGRFIATTGAAFSGSVVTDVEDTEDGAVDTMLDFMASLTSVPSAEPVSYRIGTDIVAAVEAIQAEDEFSSFYQTVQHVELANRDVFSATQFPSVYVRLVGTDVDRDADALTNSMVATVTYELLGVLETRTNVARDLARLVTDVEHALVADVTRGGLATNTRIVNWSLVLPGDDEDLASYVLVRVDVDYRTEQDDLTTEV